MNMKPRPPDSSGEEDWVLWDDWQLRSERGEWHGANVKAVDQDTTFTYVNDTEQAQRGRGFPTARASTNTDL